jgi:hypothetical protein
MNTSLRGLIDYLLQEPKRGDLQNEQTRPENNLFFLSITSSLYHKKKELSKIEFKEVTIFERML